MGGGVPIEVLRTMAKLSRVDEAVHGASGQDLG
jgi:hypothetical protein